MICLILKAFNSKFLKKEQLKRGVILWPIPECELSKSIGILNFFRKIIFIYSFIWQIFFNNIFFSLEFQENTI